MSKIEMKNKAREAIVNKLIDRLQVNDLVWNKGWVIIPMPFNETTGKKYNGINKFILSFNSIIYGFEDPRWLTFNQAKAKGYSIKKGSIASQIEVSKMIDKKTNSEVTKEILDRKKQELTEEEFSEYLRNGMYRLQKTFNVFNGSQIEGLPKYKIQEMTDEEKKKRNNRIEMIIDNSEAPVFYNGGNRAYYSPVEDTIHIPLKKRFKTLDEFYATTLHEIGHSTGHEKRLNRDLNNFFGDDKYAYEELVAEITSVFTSQALGLEMTPSLFDNRAAYVKSWYEGIKNEPDILFKAIKDADLASNYILEYENLKEKETKNITVDIQWSDNNYLNKIGSKEDCLIKNLSFPEADFLLKTLDKYYPKNYGYDKTAFVIKENEENIYEGKFDIGDGVYIKPGNYGLLEHIKHFAESQIEYYNSKPKWMKDIRTDKEIEEMKKDYIEILDKFVPMLDNELSQTPVNLKWAKDQEESIYNNSVMMFEKLKGYKDADIQAIEINEIENTNMFLSSQVIYKSLLDEKQNQREM